MSDADKKTDDQKFKETLKRMLETPPAPKIGVSSIDKPRSSARKSKRDDGEKPSQDG